MGFAKSRMSQPALRLFCAYGLPFILKGHGMATYTIGYKLSILKFCQGPVFSAQNY
jgi:hypothetical protein